MSDSAILEADERGRRCPVPVISLGRMASQASPGATIAVLADDPAAATDIPAWCRMRKAALLRVEELADELGGQRYVVRLANAGADASNAGSSAK